LREQVERIAASSTFRNAHLLRHFLLFILEKTLDGHAEQISEATIGVDVFGRGADFDPALDTIVRTHAYRLRQKLKEYNENEGASDDWIVEIPKGHYIPTVTRRRSRHLPREDARPSPEVSAPPAASRRLRHAALGAVLVLAGFGAGILAFRLLPPARSSPGIPPAVRSVWAHFQTAGAPTILAFANNQLLVTEAGDMLRYQGSALFERGSVLDPGTVRNSVSDPRMLSLTGALAFEDAYTGTGEVYSVFRLSHLFSQAGVRLQLRRSRSLTPDDLKNQNVVFLGWSPALFRELSLPLNFVFEVPSTEPARVWSGYIRNRGASSGQQTRFSVERDAKTGRILSDHALFSVLPGMAPNLRIMILAGLTTSGTQGAAEFATSQEGLTHLLPRLQSAGSDYASSPFFESVLRIGTSRGLDALSIQPVLVRSIHPKD
jgi:hypothetical protein